MVPPLTTLHVSSLKNYFNISCAKGQVVTHAKMIQYGQDCTKVTNAKMI